MSEAMTISVILPAAGKSTRFADAAGKGGKLEAELGHRAVLVRAVELFSGRPNVKQIIVAVDPDNLDSFKFKWADKLGFLGVKIVPGGRKERWETVLNAIRAVDESATHIAVHDAARPLTDKTVIDRIFEAAAKFDAVIPGVPVSATIKRTKPDVEKPAEDADPVDAILGSAGKTTIEAHRVTDTIPRNDLWLIQTPQVFKRDLLVRAYEQLAAGKIDASKITDDAGLIEAMGKPVYIVEGDPLNVKITVAEDLKFAEAVLAMRSGKPPTDSISPKRKFPTWAQMPDE